MGRKQQTRYQCTECGHVSVTWTGRCPQCGAWGTMEQEMETKAAPTGVAAVSAETLDRVERPSRFPAGIGEFDRVLGGGFVPGSVALVAGEPGIGKSTLLLQVCDGITRQGRRVLYVSAEESLSQVADRGERLGIDTGALEALSRSDTAFLEQYSGRYDIIVADSVQALQDPELDGWPGSVNQVRSVARRLIEAAKVSGTAVVLIGHVTKEGQVAGPKMLEHMVDVVLLFSGERTSPHRILRSVKNRYGSVDEIGVFEMAEQGLRPVAAPGNLYWSNAGGGVPGVSSGIVIEGTRPFVAEVQALACPTPYPYPKRTARGVEANKLQLLLAVLERRCGLSSQNQDVYVNIAGGMQVRDPAADLAISFAVASSLLDRTLPVDLCLLGEVGLAGEIRPAVMMERRLKEAARLGFTRALVSAHAEGEPPRGMKVSRADSLSEALGGIVNE
ncbi:MAG: DNA repair protein RadA [Synergistales bacterium]|nr:DNA repair protein RadA [Synergistales bacterium]